MAEAEATGRARRRGVAPGVAVDSFFTIPGKELGPRRLAEHEIDVRVGMRGTMAELKTLPAT